LDELKAWHLSGRSAEKRPSAPTAGGKSDDDHWKDPFDPMRQMFAATYAKQEVLATMLGTGKKPGGRPAKWDKLEAVIFEMLTRPDGRAPTNAEIANEYNGRFANRARRGTQTKRRYPKATAADVKRAKQSIMKKIAERVGNVTQ
jgi:hypothetical protein